MTFKMKTRCYLHLLTPETIELPGSIESKIRMAKMGHILKLQK